MTYIKITLKRFFILALIALTAFSGSFSVAQNNQLPPIIRDTEIENSFKEWMIPLLKASDLGLNSVNLILVKSDQVNAFVAGGANIFIYTGLIERTDDPGEVIGVLAHELGHIAGGHLIGTRGALERASYESILGMVLGLGAAIATGNGGAAGAIISGTNSTAQRRFLANSRVNESSADQAALKFLEKSELNAQGLKIFLEKLGSEELLPADQQSEYVRTHPLTRNRIDALETNINKSVYKGRALPDNWNVQHARMKAKLISFINPGRVPWVYDDRDKSVPARYARAIAAYRLDKVEEALQEIDTLIALEPVNPYFQELKGQMLKDFGRVKEALPYYKKAVTLLPDAGLIRIDLAHALMESGSGQAEMNEAVNHLQRALRDEPRSTRAHRLLATAYGRRGQENLAKLHLAEEATLQRRLPYAKSQAEAVLENSKKGDREWIKAKDLLAHIENLERLEN